MTSLSVLEYDSAEKIALARTPNRIIETIQTVIFDRCGYPTRVASESELYRYIQATGETLYEERVERLLANITPAEFELWKQLWAIGAGFTEQKFGKRILPRSTIAAGMNVLRHIRYLYGDSRPRVFEAGPGGGDFAALLMLERYPYAGTDITQALYLTQNHYWNAITQGQVVETARTGGCAAALGNIVAGAPVHVPWWEFYHLVPNEIPNFDIVVCNHALCEMHDWSMRYLLRFSRDALRGDANQRKLFIFEGWGWSGPTDRERAVKLFLQFGFRMVHHDLQIAVFAPQGSRDAEYACEFPIVTESHTAQITPEGKISLQPVKNHSYASVYYENPMNAVTKSILAGRQLINAQKTIGQRELNEVATSLLGTTDHRSDDEKYWELIGLKSEVGSPG